MEISDIQKLSSGKIKITFCSEPDMLDCMNIIVSENDLIQIKNWWSDNLSYGAQLKKQRNEP